uniref:Uncharacterized protein n=1 Tax=Zea mays TaxID=4577 RepID=A0A804N6P4_MAIZE
MAMVDEGGKGEAQPPGLDPRNRRSAATRATGDMDGGGRGEEWEGPPGYVLSLPAAALPLPVAVSCLDATVRRKGRSHIRHRGHPSGWWAFRLPVPAPEEAKRPVPPASAANNPSEEDRSCPRHQRLPVRQAPAPGPHTPAPGEEEASETGETPAASEDGTRGGAAASASGVPRQEEEKIGFGEEAVAAPEVGEAVLALRVVVDAAVAGRAAGPQHAVQRVRRAVQAGPVAAGVPAAGEPHLRAVGARQQAQPGDAAPPAAEEPGPAPPSARGASASHGRPPVSPAVAGEGGVPADAAPPASAASGGGRQPCQRRAARWGHGRRCGRCRTRRRRRQGK